MIEFILTHPLVWLLPIWAGLNVAIGYRSQIERWCERHPRIAGPIKILRGAFPFDVWQIAQGVNLLVKGRLPAAIRAESQVLPATAQKIVDALIEVEAVKPPTPEQEADTRP